MTANATEPPGWSLIDTDIDGVTAGDILGYSVSLSKNGNILAVGAPASNESIGYVKVYEKVNGAWQLFGPQIDGEQVGENFGFSVSLSGDGYTLAVGSPYYDNGTVANVGRGRVFKYNNSQKKWVQYGSTLLRGADGYNVGYSISLNYNGSVLAIGAPLYNNITNTIHIYQAIRNAEGGSGFVFLYKYDSDWVSSGLFNSGTAPDYFYDVNLSSNPGTPSLYRIGRSVALNDDGTVIAIGAPSNFSGTTSVDAGGVYICKYNSSSGYWSTIGTIEGEANGDKSGSTVSLNSDGTVVAIGAKWNDPIINDAAANKAGHVRVYKYVSLSGWNQLGSDIDGEVAEDMSGYTVSLSADGFTVAIGAPLNSSIKGDVRVLKYDSASGWVPMGSPIIGEAANNESGFSVSLSADGLTVAIGAPVNDPTTDTVNAGHVRVYEYIDNTTTTTTAAPTHKTELSLVKGNSVVDPVTGKTMSVWSLSATTSEI